MVDQDEKFVGYIHFVYFDKETNETLTLESEGYVSKEEDASAWMRIGGTEEESPFQADRLNAKLDLVDEKAISKETCERLAGRSIDDLIREARAKIFATMPG